MIKLKITDIKINGFGQLFDREYKLSEGINLIIGNNETGKSTLLKFIQTMLFGISKNKNGKPISDFDKYKPWEDIPYSGKIGYSLDNENNYEVFRDFAKKSNKIFNSNMEDISSNFSIDKAKGPNFFAEQTGITEDIFMKTAIIEQQEVKLDKLDQNIILQKISNLVSTGDDTVSFKKLMDKLNKKQLDEVGTSRSTERPMNILLDRIETCKFNLRNIESTRDEEIDIKEEIKIIDKELNQLQNELELYRELQNIRNNERIDYSQIETVEKIISEYESKIKILKEDIKMVNKPKSLLKYGVLGTFLLVIYTLLFFIFKLPIPYISICAVLFVISIYFLYKGNYNNKNYNLNIEKLNREIEILNSGKIEKEKEISEMNSRFNNIKLSSNDYIRSKYSGTDVSIALGLSPDELISKTSHLETIYSEKKIHLNTLLIKLQNNSLQIDELANNEELLLNLNDNLAELYSLNNSINIAKEALEEAYEEVRNSITPSFILSLSSLISEISDNKYKKIKFDDIKGLVVELDNGDYITSEFLSIGTIDQMYVSLRLSALKEISNEQLPILLDEAFVYFDDNRLENILEYISNEFNQVIIFSCSNREKDTLDEMNIKYNLLSI